MNEYAIPEMIDYLRRIGYEPEDLNKLGVVHVTGTKGKGSTCAFVEKILRTELGDGARVGEWFFGFCLVWPPYSGCSHWGWW
jgi:folylpolyglutamate synthase/dihydropteroate synthase